MARQKASVKLLFTATCEHLKEEIEVNTIPQFITNFKYVENWGSSKKVASLIPNDAKNVNDFFTAVRKLSDIGFQPKKFHDLWTKHNMEDLTDYHLTALGVADDPAKEDKNAN
jgi:hypothetical protein